MTVGERMLGCVRLRITSGDITYALQELSKANVLVLEAEVESELSALVLISTSDFKKTIDVLNRIGAHTQLITRRGLLQLLCKLRKRVILIGTCIVLILFTLWIPTRIFFWEVKGNNQLPANYIIAQAQSCGLTFGCKRSEIRSERIKNLLLSQIPQLEWIGVTTSGCVVTICVSESQSLQQNDDAIEPGNVVAVCDGVVSSVTVTKGNPVCKTGQAVQKGQVLISGYEDCGLLIKHTGAQGDVYANTLHKVEGVLPTLAKRRVVQQQIKKRYCLKIGKNIINFSKDSGISDISCVKMYAQRSVTLPGDFQLPVSLIQETYYSYELCSTTLEERDYEWIESVAETYLRNQMLGGMILHKETKILSTDDVYRFRGIYRCTEQIGVNMIEEILSYGKNS